LRSNLDNRIAGFGTMLAFVENEEVWKDKKCRDVRFPKHEGKLHGEVRTYYLSKEELEKYRKNLHK
jgi:hypothetical protein